MIWQNKELKTVGEIFDTALNLAKTDKRKAGAFFNACVDYVRDANGCSREEAEKIVKGNFGYYSGYYNKEVSDIIYSTYCCEHPIFGKHPFDVSPEDAYRAGLEAGYKYK
jgi:hypothetical protein